MGTYSTALRAAACAFALAISFAASAASFEAGHRAWIGKTVVLRARPDQVSATVWRAEPATEVRLKSATDSAFGRWWLVDIGGHEGWALEKYLTLEEPHVAAAPAPATAPAVAPAPAPTMAASAAPATAVAPAPRDPNQEDRSAEIQKIWNGITSAGTPEERIRFCQMLPFSGITDAAFFEKLDGWLKEQLRLDEQSTQMAEADVSRCLQGLAASGNPQYLATIHRWEASPQMGRGGKHYIKRTEQLLVQSSVWNLIINNTASHTGTRSWESSRVINMLKSHDAVLMKEGMRRISHNRKELADTFDTVEAELLAMYTTIGSDSQREDVVAWLCKTLAVSRDLKYKTTLDKVLESAESYKLKNNAEGSLKLLQSPADEVAEGPKDEGQ